MLLTDHLITGYSLRSEPAHEKCFKSSHLYIKDFVVYLGGYIRNLRGAVVMSLAL